MVNCTAPCAVTATEAFEFSLVDESNPDTGGINLIGFGTAPT
jgi:hypothetical protein